jgi:16S rRNA U1498 N3-methylase RsmE
MKIGRLKSIPTVFSLPVRELRRLLIPPDRFVGSELLRLHRDESHYLRRVLRLRVGDSLDKHSVVPIHLGGSILRTSTAAVAGAVELVRWREQQFNS